MPNNLTHIDEQGRASMVDVSEKPITKRFARAQGRVHLNQSTLEAIAQNRIAKGEVLATARIAAIMAAKRCDELIPLCHTVPLDEVQIDFVLSPETGIVEIESQVLCHGRTGVEMEALIAVSVAALTIYDMVKSIDRQAVIGEIRLIEKSGGKSGHFFREEQPCRGE